MMKKILSVLLIGALSAALLCGCVNTNTPEEPETTAVPVVVEDTREDTSLPREGDIWDYLTEGETEALRAADAATIVYVGCIRDGEDGESAYISYDASVIEQALTALSVVTIGEQNGVYTEHGNVHWCFSNLEGRHYYIDFNGDNFCMEDGPMYEAGNLDALSAVLGLMKPCTEEDVCGKESTGSDAAAEAPVSEEFAFDPEDGVDSVLSDDWNYDCVILADGTEELTFNQQVVIAIPADWEGKYTMEADGNFVTFYHTASLEAWRENEGYDSGVLFTLALEDSEQDIEVLPDYEILGQTDAGIYYLYFPTDVQAYYEDETVMAEYSAMFAETDFIRTTSGVMVG